MNGGLPTDARASSGALLASSHRPPWRGGRLAGVVAASLLLHLALIALPGPGRRLVDAPGARLAATLTPATTTVGQTPSAAPGQQGHEKAAAAGGVPQTATTAAAAPALPAELLPSAPYYPSEQLTVRPAALAEPELDPAELANLVASGEIALTLWIDERGEVVDVDVDHSELPGAFVRAATSAFGALRFAPGEVDGRRVGSVLRVAVRYDDLRLANAR